MFLKKRGAKLIVSTALILVGTEEIQKEPRCFTTREIKSRKYQETSLFQRRQNQVGPTLCMNLCRHTRKMLTDM